MKSLNLPRRPTNDEDKHRICTSTLKMRIGMNGVAMHTSTTGDMQGRVSTWPIDLLPPNVPIESPRWHTDQTDVLKTYTCTLNVRAQAHSNADSRSRPASASITTDLHARGAVSRMGESEVIRDQMDALDPCTYARIIVDESKSCKHVRNSRLTYQKHKNAYRRPSEARKPNGCVGRVHLCIERCE